MSTSIRQIARETGLSPASVSLALRGKGRISAETRERIRQVANRLEYLADPLLSKAFSIVRQQSAPRYRETIAFLVEYPTETGPAYQQTMFQAARERAKTFGYVLESFVVSGKPSDQRRLSRMLHARGIRGVIVIPRLECRQPRLCLEWEKFAPVEIGRSLWAPRNLHHVETGDYNKIIEAMHLLKKAGYRRIGMAVESDQIKQQRGSYNAAYVVTQLRLPASQQIPPLSILGAWSEATFRSWLAKYKPDVLFIHDTETICAWLKRMGLQIPRDISLFCANAKDAQLSGLRRDYVGLGRSAVEMVALLLESNDLGLQSNPRCWQVDEFWQIGSTLGLPISKYVPVAMPWNGDLALTKSFVPQP